MPGSFDILGIIDRMITCFADFILFNMFCAMSIDFEATDSGQLPFARSFEHLFAQTYVFVLLNCLLLMFLQHQLVLVFVYIYFPDDVTIRR